MGAIRKIDLSVREDLANRIDAAVASGEFASADDVVTAALDAFNLERLPPDPENTLRLRQLWEEGIASGPAVEGNFDLADIKRRAAERQNIATSAN